MCNSVGLIAGFLSRALLVLASLGLSTAASAQPPGSTPDHAPDRYVLAHVDIETTGLDPAVDEMVSIGMIYTDLQGAEIGRLDLRIMPPNPGRIDAGARAVNGFDPALWRRLGATLSDGAGGRDSAWHVHADCESD